MQEIVGLIIKSGKTGWRRLNQILNRILIANETRVAIMS